MNLITQRKLSTGSGSRVSGFFKLILLAGLTHSSILVADTLKEIDHLLGFILASPCRFERNGTMHNGPEARDHISMKYEHYRTRVITAEDFIEYSATRSTMSGKHYRIHCPGSDTKNTSDWLLTELHEYRRQQDR